MVFADIIIGLMAFMVVMLIHKNLFIITNFIGFMPVITSMILSMLISSYILNINKIVLRGFNLNDLSLLFIYAFISSILLYVSIFFLFTNNSTIEVAIKLGFSRIIIIYLPVLFIGILFFRIFSIYILNRISFKNQTRKKVIIYGAGNAGIQLMRSYEKENSIEFLCFIDENPNLRNAIISGVTIYSRKDFERNILKNQADEVWIAIPSLKVTELEKIIQYLSTFSKKILSLPEINNLRFNSSFKNQ
jgi:FlaA1/EpsC-like NDP-sugar epimerase